MNTLPLPNQMAAYPLEGRQFSLRTVIQSDYPYIYLWATTPPTGLTWRLRGTTPSPEQFPLILWEGVLTQFVVVDKKYPELPLGLLQAFNHDPGNGVVYLSVILDPGIQNITTAMAEGVILLLKFIFTSFNIRKVYAETTEIAVNGLSRLAQSWDCISEEGRLRKHMFYADGYRDLVILAIERAAFFEEIYRIDKIITPRPISHSDLPSFAEFIENLPPDLFPLMTESSQLDGGTLLADELGLDSLGLAELGCWIEEQFGISPLLEDSIPLRTLQDLYVAMETSILE